MSQRKPVIAGNWKMNCLRAEAQDLTTGIAQWVAQNGKGRAEIVLCPPFTALSDVVRLGSNLGVGGQNVHANASGAHTGDISADMLKDAGCGYVIVGHSERRADHGETDAVVAAKAKAAQDAQLISIICVGETLQQRDAGQTFDVVNTQVLNSVPAGSNAQNTVIAYEPVWAIGTGKVASPEQAQEVHAAIRATLSTHLGQDQAQAMRILYGGSMKPDNAAVLLALPDVDGGLIGGAALKVGDFTAIIGMAEAEV